MKIFAPLFLVLLLLTSCQDEASTLSFSEKSYTTASLPECKEDLCPKIAIQLLMAEGKSPLAKTINTAIEEKIATGLAISPEEEGKIKTIDEGVTNFIKEYRTANSEFPNLPSTEGYEFTSNSSISLETESLLSIAIEMYSYWGGAHGYGSTTYVNFDKKDGKQLTMDNLIKDKQKFRELAERLFRKEEDIPETRNINNTGYFFENDTFSLPNNFGFEKDTLILIYNPYEVASYAEGQITIKIPKAEAAPFLSVHL
ncbi:DUF3298 and DUF4163 domain-containing protein [Flavimarina sp. Hel_I_48]|uniref:DUF3298 and DUF4163 domain-containing protein n=1 Tax=Flavimarina sp. Hel_I_48 TaxID=1392488 RepID=UPI0004DF8A0E|nr:DUF3298 and DUF4163 domain-containing protein [Flavimarina sp. Hel_I_48]